MLNALQNFKEDLTYGHELRAPRETLKNTQAERGFVNFEGVSKCESEDRFFVSENVVRRKGHNKGVARLRAAVGAMAYFKWKRYDLVTKPSAQGLRTLRLFTYSLLLCGSFVVP